MPGRRRKMPDMKKQSAKKNSCEYCGNYAYVEENDYYVCEVNLDEDEMVRFLSGRDFACPYYQPGDEYRIVRKQM